MECVNLKDSDDVVFNEVLGVAMLLPAVESMWMRKFSLL